jgi:hypothetical protein
MHAQGKTNVGPAIAAQGARFERAVVEAAAAKGETLSPAEIARRAGYLRKSSMAALALKASRARGRKAKPAPAETRFEQALHELMAASGV